MTSARELFGDRGFERTTIRAVAADAGVDPALVIQYFGSKQDLFSAAVRAAPDPGFAGEPDELVGFLLDTLSLKLRENDQAPLAMLRSMLTHPEASEHAREIVDRQGAQIARAIPGPDAPLQAALVTSTMLGLRIGRELLQLAEISTADPEEIARLMRPCLEAMTAPAGD